VKRLAVIVGVVAVAVGVAITYWQVTADLPPQVIAGRPDAGPPSQWTVEVTYIAGSGVLLSSGGTQVLIDGLFREYQTYPYLPQPHQDLIETAKAPFDRIDLILVSHRHGDHFHPESVARHLQSNSQAFLLSSQQVVDEVRTQPGFAAIASRVTTTAPSVPQRIAMSVAGVQVDVLGLGHGTGRNRDIQNLGHVITVGGMKFLHVGDADPTAAIFEPLKLDEQGVDVAIIPMWFLEDGAAVVREHIRPKHIIAVHMARAETGLSARAAEAFPGAVAFTRLLEKRYY
jgi:L-ascorbate metabolism protein UlaG (beta-lactamase superfamily)